LGQADGVPYDGLYPLPNWRPGQVIEDVRPVPLREAEAGLAAITVGIYDPATGERLPATDAAGQPLPENRLVIPVSPQQ
jgi:hypothetical protein